MKFSGIQKTSLLDFPDKVSTVLFTPQCNLRCPYCHNWRLVLNSRSPFLKEDEAIQILEERKKYINAVAVTGGEPTIQKDIPQFLEKLRERGFSVKLDTNGFFPQVLEECLSFVDYVSLDVKTSLEKYRRLGAEDTAALLLAVELLKDGEVEYEFRATAVPGFFDEEDIPKIGEIINGGKCFAIQQFVPGDTLDNSYSNVKPYPAKAIIHFAEMMKQYVGEVVLRI